MELAVLAEISFIVLISVIAGYKMGKGDPLKIELPRRFRPVIRTEEQEAKLIDKVRGVK